MRRLFAAALAVLLLALAPAADFAAAAPSPALIGAVTPARDASLAGGRARRAARYDPSWIVLDFTTGYYQDGKGGYGFGNPSGLPGWSFSRAGQELAFDASGNLQAFASGVPAITDAGLSVYEARTNKNTNYNTTAADVATPIVGNGSTTDRVLVGSLPAPAYAALLASKIGGLVQSGVITAVYHTVTTGSANTGSQADRYVVAGPAGNTNPHVVSAFAYVVSGSPSLGIGNASVVRGSTALLSNWTQTTYANTPNATDMALRMYGTPNVVTEWYWILNQYEEGSFATPPIVTAGASATRAASVARLTGLTAPANWTALSKWVSQSETSRGGGGWLYKSDETTLNSVGMDRTSNGRTFVRVNNVLQMQLQNLNVAAAGATQRQAVTWNGSTYSTTANAQGVQSAGNTALDWDRALFGGPQPINTTVQALIIYPGAMTAAQLQALTAP